MALYVGNTRYKVMVGSQKHDFVVPLPYDAEVEWLQSDGNAYIDTGIKVAGNLSANVYLVDFFTSEFVGRSAFGGLDHIAEGDWDSDIRQFGFGINPDDKAVFYYDSSSIVFDDYSTYPQSARVVIENGVISVDSEQYTYIPASFTTLMSIILFGWHTGPIFNTPCKMGPCYLSDGTTTLDLIPVRKDDVGYMYDKISGKLFGREETGNFIIGPDKNLPYDAEIEYLESVSGSWIDTGFKPNQNTNINIEISIIRDGIISRFFETRNSTWNAEYAILNFGQSDNQLQARFGNASKGTKIQNKLLPGSVYKLSIREHQFFINDTSVKDLGTYTFQCNYSLPLFALNNGGAMVADTQQLGRIHSCSIYDGNTLVLDFIPVRVGTVGYLYDKVSRQLFGNAGTGNFILGNDVTT